jgi:hypothetical protein
VAATHTGFIDKIWIILRKEALAGADEATGDGPANPNSVCAARWFADYNLQFFRHDSRFHHPFFRRVATGRSVHLESSSERKVLRIAAFTPLPRRQPADQIVSFTSIRTVKRPKSRAPGGGLSRCTHIV